MRRDTNWIAFTSWAFCSAQGWWKAYQVNLNDGRNINIVPRMLIKQNIQLFDQFKRKQALQNYRESLLKK